MTITKEDFLSTTMAKSEQINSSDLLGGPLVCQITDIQMTGSADQPISIFVDAHPQPWKPSKTSRRVLAACWADADPSDWVGRFVVLFNDPTVMWAGKAEGGIRCSHLSHIDGKKTVKVNATRGKKVDQVVEPYYPQEQAPQQPTYWPDDAFDKQASKAEPKIRSQETTADAVITALEKKALLTEGQKSRLRRFEIQEDQSEPIPDNQEPPDIDPFAE
jgi:hypothetical protein